ncbi:MAG: hypothetical protein HOL66_07430 [Rhodospirillaceae bacterium]|jgi:hypothetical protein|nr:hypothetical protein [Rhodospirillaceae bacterium]MBT5244060.1 hypothetical protein [Rhodospirillaceae bacterium]MBT5560880.1 hypothetical protein [Rhodospirillaceae bacterium]MBT6241169.1 hypothetical protein [Rhodospirillaceae bacterium]MBT7136526.1 hypothetical protein [Rhodospirillaceae bacterium]
MSTDKNAINEDARNVNQAANLLGLREIDFFRLAHRRWHSNDASKDQMEKIFTAYMFHETVPPWVRHCAREVINREGMNMLDPAQFGVGDFRHQSKVPKVGKLFLMIAGLLMVIVYISILTTKHGFDDTNCPGRYANRFVEQWVYMINGEQPPACKEGEVKEPAPQ